MYANTSERANGDATCGLGLIDAHLARADAPQQIDEAGHVEDVLQATAVGLEHDREAREPARDGEQVLRLEPLHPERRTRARPAPRQQQRAGGVLPEVRGEHGRMAELRDDQVLDQLGVGQQRVCVGQLVGVGEAQHDAVVARHRLHLVAGCGGELRFERQRPRRVHARAERREDADAPVAEFVAEALDRDGAVGGQRAGGFALFVQVIEQVARGERVEMVRRAQPRFRFVARLLGDFAHEGAECAAEFDRPARPFAAPERQAPGLAGRGRDEHAVARDLGDAPGRGAERDRLPGPRLEDHLLVEFADARTFGADVHVIHAAVGDRAAREQSELARRRAWA